MNVFMLSMNHENRATYHRDDHVNKMLTEAVQIMNNALHIRGRDDLAFYSPSHLHHPWSEWAAESLRNWKLLDNHANALGREYILRSKYANERQTADRKRMEEWGNEEREEIARVLPDGPFTEMPVCTNDYETNGGTIVEKYRDYYANVKATGDRAVWTDRERPEWIDEYR